MLKRLLRAISTVEAFDSERQEISQGLIHITEALTDLQGRQSRLEGNQGTLESNMRTEVLNMAELYGKTYRLLKRMQAEDRHDADHAEEPDITPVADPVSERVLARRRADVSQGNTHGAG